MATQNRLPTGDSGTQNNWTAINAGSKFSEVDDPIGTPDEDATHVLRAGAGAAIQNFTFPAFSITSSAIASVTVSGRTMRTAFGAVATIFILQVGGVNDSSASITTGTTYEDKSETWLTNPTTALAWTEAEVEALVEFGLNSGSQGAGEEIRCTQVYVTVDYTAAAGNSPSVSPSASVSASVSPSASPSASDAGLLVIQRTVLDYID